MNLRSLSKGIKNILQKCLFSLLVVMPYGCSFAPTYHRPTLPTAETYPREECEQDCSNICQLCWQDYFTDPALQQLIALALENNRDLRTAIYRIDEAISLYGLRRADLFPTLGGVGMGFRSRLPGEILSELPAPATTTPGTVAPSPNTDKPTFLSAYMAGLSVAWEVDFWGRLRNLKDVALDIYLSTAEAEHATYKTLIKQVANTYITELELNELISIALRTVQTREESYHLLKRRYEEGSSSKLDAIQAEILLLQAKTDLTVLERRRELNWNAMTLLIGVPAKPVYLLLSQVESFFMKKICAGLPSDLLYNRPDILSAEYKLRAANANIGAARAAFFPAIALTGAFGSASSELDHLFKHGTKFWYYLPIITVPIFDWGRNESDLGLAKARKHVAVSEYEQTIQVAFKEVSDALAEKAWLEEQIVYQEQSVDAERERVRLTWIRYEHGSAPYYEVLDAERDKFNAEQALVQTRRDYLASGINLFTALGGGYCR